MSNGSDKKQAHVCCRNIREYNNRSILATISIGCDHSKCQIGATLMKSKLVKTCDVKTVCLH